MLPCEQFARWLEGLSTLWCLELTKRPSSVPLSILSPRLDGFHNLGEIRLMFDLERSDVPHRGGEPWQGFQGHDRGEQVCQVIFVGQIKAAWHPVKTEAV